MSDEIVLTLPAEEDFRRVAHLVLGGLAVRLDLTWEHLEDIQLGLDSLLERREDEDDVTVAVRVEGGALRTKVGPFADGVLSDLDRDSAALGLRRVLEAVADRIEVVRGEGGHWVELTKAVR